MNAAARVRSGDADGDGDLDPAARCTSGPAPVGVLLGAGDGRSGAAITTAALRRITGGMRLQDMEGDGKADLPGSTDGDSFMAALSNDDGTFRAQPPRMLGFGVTALRVTDVNKDSTPDLLTISGNSSALNVLLRRSNGSFGVPWRFPLGLFPLGGDLTTADVNSDGKPDLLMIVGRGGMMNGVWVLLNESQEAEPRRTHLPQGPGVLVADPVPALVSPRSCSGWRSRPPPCPARAPG